MSLPSICLETCNLFAFSIKVTKLALTSHFEGIPIGAIVSYFRIFAEHALLRQAFTDSLFFGYSLEFCMWVIRKN